MFWCDSPRLKNQAIAERCIVRGCRGNSRGKEVAEDSSNSKPDSLTRKVENEDEDSSENLRQIHKFYFICNCRILTGRGRIHFSGSARGFFEVAAREFKSCIYKRLVYKSA
ncbi:unnamed protein product [Vicia faba]|uniref:Uncharacterized protein n=1 Tax=Vicia faba TaxID=3906 RepID=A0AAV1A9H8_VICFA|nr:unnamed protein product [Vicia faba]